MAGGQLFSALNTVRYGAAAQSVGATLPGLFQERWRPLVARCGAARDRLWITTNFHMSAGSITAAGSSGYWQGIGI
jgi:hypothetical protein